MRQSWEGAKQRIQPAARLSFLSRATRRLDQQGDQQDSEQRPGCSEAEEWPAPVVAFCKPARKKTTHNGARVDAGLVKAERAGTRAWPVIVAHHGERSRKVEAFAEPHDAAQNGQAPEPACKGRCGADPTPEFKAAEDRGFGHSRPRHSPQMAQPGRMPRQTRSPAGPVRRDRDEGATAGAERRRRWLDGR